MFKDMTREEQIEKAGKECYNKDSHYYACNDEDAIITAFGDGAKWADEHPINDMWHTPDEEPQGKNWCIMARDGQGLLWTTTRADAGIITSSGWHQYVWKHNLIEWYYYKYPEVTVK